MYCCQFRSCRPQPLPLPVWGSVSLPSSDPCTHFPVPCVPAPPLSPTPLESQGLPGVLVRPLNAATGRFWTWSLRLAVCPGDSSQLPVSSPPVSHRVRASSGWQMVPVRAGFGVRQVLNAQGQRGILLVQHLWSSGVLGCEPWLRSTAWVFILCCKSLLTPPVAGYIFMEPPSRLRKEDLEIVG